MDLDEIYQRIDLMEFGVDYAQRQGASQAEVFLSVEESKRAQIEKGKITTIQDSSDSGAFVRVFAGKMLGSHVFTDLTREGIVNAVTKALRMAKVEDPSCAGFPTPRGAQGIHLNLDKKTYELTSEDVVDSCRALIYSVKERDRRVKPTDGLVSSDIIMTSVANSNGVSVTDIGSKLISSIRTRVKSGERVGNGYDYSISRDYSSLHPEKVGRASAELSVTSLKKKQIKPGKYSVVFDPHAFTDIIKGLVLPATFGVNIQHKASFLRERVGEQVFGENVTLIDDGTWREGANRYYVDHEGTPAQRTTIFDRGKLQGLLYDHASAQKDGCQSTGNGIRFLTTLFEKIYRYTPQVEGTNTILVGGSASRDELIEDVSEGILVGFLVGSWSFNFTNGSFSGEARNSYKIENGRIAYAINEATVSGPIFSLLYDLQIGNNSTQSRGYVPLTPAVVVTPTVVAKNVNVGA